MKRKKSGPQVVAQPIATGSLWCGDAEALNICLSVQERLASMSLSEQLKMQAEVRELEVKLFSGENDYAGHYMIDTYADGRIAVLNISGPLMAHQMPLRMFGLPVTTYGEIQAAAQQLRDDPKVEKVVLRVNSPGGSGHDMARTGNQLDKLAKLKDVSTFTDSNMASAGYWLGVAGGHIVADATAHVGSIGVYSSIISHAERNRAEGREVRVVRAGEFKALGHPDEAITEKAVAELDRIVSATYDAFLDRSSSARGVDRESFRANAAEGRVFMGQEAIDVGLVDEIADYDDYIGGLIASLASKKPAVGARPVTGNRRLQLKGVNMNIFEILKSLGISLSAAQTSQLESGVDVAEIGLSAGDLKKVEDTVRAEAAADNSGAGEGAADVSAGAGAADAGAGEGAGEGAADFSANAGTADAGAGASGQAFSMQLGALAGQITELSTQLGQAKLDLALAVSGKEKLVAQLAAANTLLEAARPAIAAAITRMQISLRATADDSLESRDVASLISLHSEVREKFERMFPVGRRSKTPVDAGVAGADRVVPATVHTAAVTATRI